MGGEVLVALLVTVVLGDEVEVLATDDEGTVHLGRDNGTGQDTATDGDLAGEGALLVCSGGQFISAICSSFVSFRLCRHIALFLAVNRSLARASACCLVVVVRCGLRYFVVPHLFVLVDSHFATKAGGRSRKGSS